MTAGFGKRAFIGQLGCRVVDGGAWVRAQGLQYVGLCGCAVYVRHVRLAVNMLVHDLGCPEHTKVPCMGAIPLCLAPTCKHCFLLVPTSCVGALMAAMQRGC